MTQNQNYLTATCVNTFLEKNGHLAATYDERIQIATDVYNDIQSNRSSDTRIDEALKNINFTDGYVQQICMDSQRLTPYTLEDVENADAANADIRVISCSHDSNTNPSINDTALF